VSGSINRVTLLGNLAADPEIRATVDGKRIANLRLATSESWVDKATGERKERTEWHRVVVFSDGLCGIVEKFLHKGSKVFLEGQLKTRKWTDQQSVDHYATEVVMQSMDHKLFMCDGKPDAQPQQHAPGGGGSAPYRAPNAIQYGQPQVVHTATAVPRGRQLPPERDLQDEIVW